MRASPVPVIPEKWTAHVNPQPSLSPQLTDPLSSYHAPGIAAFVSVLTGLRLLNLENNMIAAVTPHPTASERKRNT